MIFMIIVLKLFLTLLFASALICSMAHAKQVERYSKSNAKAKSISAKSTKAANAKSKSGAKIKKTAAYKLKPAETRARNFFFASYQVVRDMGYTRNEAINGAFAYTLHCWRESNMHGQGVAKWLWEKHHVINPGHITVLSHQKGVWKSEWANGKKVRKKWATWLTYEDAAKGTIEYIKRNHPKAFEAALRGDINGYADAVSNSNYHSGNPQDYKKVLVDCVPTIKRMIEKAKG